MILIVFGQEERDYKNCVDRSIEYFRSLPTDQVQYIKEDGGIHYLTHFIFTGPMAVKMYSYACTFLPLKILYCQEKSDQNDMIGYLESVKNQIERGRVEFNTFKPKPIVFCTSLHCIHRLTTTAYIIFKSYEKRFIHDNSNYTNKEHFDVEMNNINSYLSFLTDKSNNEV
jgi:hypothetical protein